MNKDRQFKVVIYSITFNHASYIKDTLSGFAMQQTDFPFLALVIDDASTDGEQEVIRNYIDEQLLTLILFVVFVHLRNPM